MFQPEPILTSMGQISMAVNTDQGAGISPPTVVSAADADSEQGVPKPIDSDSAASFMDERGWTLAGCGNHHETSNIPLHFSEQIEQLEHKTCTPQLSAGESAQDDCGHSTTSSQSSESILGFRGTLAVAKIMTSKSTYVGTMEAEKMQQSALDALDAGHGAVASAAIDDESKLIAFQDVVHQHQRLVSPDECIADATRTAGSCIEQLLQHKS
jgi:hypothetical protein